jgi:hypothetical protein
LEIYGISATSPIQAVAHHWITQSRKMSTDLVLTAGLDAHLEVRLAMQKANAAELANGRFSIERNVDAARGLVVRKVAMYRNPVTLGDGSFTKLAG